MKKYLLLLILPVLLLISCNSLGTKEKKKKITINYTLYVEEKSNKQISFTQLKSRSLEIIAGYIFGSNFENIDDNNIKVSFQNNLTADMYEKLKNEMSNIEYGDKSYFVEDVKIKYSPEIKIEKGAKKVSVSSTSKSKNFQEAYNNLITDTIRKNTKPKDKGIIIPTANLSVTLKDQFIISCKFDIYIFK